MGATDLQQNIIISDIYGCEQDQVFHVGLIDADSEFDLKVEFRSLDEIWESLVSGFHDRFEKKRIHIFISDLDKVQVDIYFYNNSVEVLHKLQKRT